MVVLVGITLALPFLGGKSKPHIAGEFTVFGPPWVSGTNLVYVVELQNVGQVPFINGMGRWNFFSVELPSSEGWVEPKYVSFTRGFPLIDPDERYFEMVWVPISASTWRVTTDEVYKSISHRNVSFLEGIDRFIPFLQFVPQSLMNLKTVNGVILQSPPWNFDEK